MGNNEVFMVIRYVLTSMQTNLVAPISAKRWACKKKIVGISAIPSWCVWLVLLYVTLPEGDCPAGYAYSVQMGSQGSFHPKNAHCGGYSCYVKSRTVLCLLSIPHYQQEESDVINTYNKQNKLR